MSFDCRFLQASVFFENMSLFYGCAAALAATPCLKALLEFDDSDAAAGRDESPASREPASSKNLALAWLRV